MTMKQTNLKLSRAKALFFVATLAAASIILPGAATVENASSWFCCLDEWQGGGICPSGQRVASYCAGPAGCENCGTMFCYTQPWGPGRQCLQ
jgi:hypothetical protein